MQVYNLYRRIKKTVALNGTTPVDVHEFCGSGNFDEIILDASAVDGAINVTIDLYDQDYSDKARTNLGTHAGGDKYVLSVDKTFYSGNKVKAVADGATTASITVIICLSP